MNLGWIIVVIVVIGGIYYAYTNPSVVSNVLGAVGSSPLSMCNSQMNGVVANLQAQNPSGTTIDTVNTTWFNYVGYNATLQNILQWGKLWNKNYVAINDDNPPTFKAYASLAAMGNTTTQKAGIGEAIRMTTPVQRTDPNIYGQATFVAYLCDSRGVLLSSSSVQTVS